MSEIELHRRLDKTAEGNASSDTRQAKIRIKNRRKLYLDRHPSYFDSPELELADPLLYDRCIRRYQTASEREADGRSKGYSGVLEADLYRSEAKLAALAGERPVGGDARSEGGGGGGGGGGGVGVGVGGRGRSVAAGATYVRGPDGSILPEDPDEIPESKDAGMEQWRYEMTLRFLRGDDADIDYAEIDESPEWDQVEQEEESARWFDDERPEWDGQSGDIARGETGIQDF